MRTLSAFTLQNDILKNIFLGPLLTTEKADQRVIYCHCFGALVTTHHEWNNILTSGDI